MNFLLLIRYFFFTLVHARYVFVYTKTPCINRVDVFQLVLLTEIYL